MKNPATDDFYDTQACAAPVSTPADVMVRADKFGDRDYLTFDAGSNHIYWVRCGTDDPLCITNIRGADGGIVAKNRTISNPNAIGYGAFWFRPAADGQLWADIYVESGTLHWYLLEYGLDDHPTPQPIVLSATPNSVSLETDLDSDTFTIYLDAGTSVVLNVPTAVNNMKVDVFGPGVQVPTKYPPFTQTINAFGTGTYTIQFNSVSYGDMAGPIDATFTLQ